MLNSFFLQVFYSFLFDIKYFEFFLKIMFIFHISNKYSFFFYICQFLSFVIINSLVIKIKFITVAIVFIVAIKFTINVTMRNCLITLKIIYFKILSFTNKKFIKKYMKLKE